MLMLEMAVTGLIVSGGSAISAGISVLHSNWSIHGGLESIVSKRCCQFAWAARVVAG